MVFVDGDANMLPWYRRAEKLQLLFRMCERTKKVLFAAACGMHMLVFLASCAQPISRVVNGNGKGGSAADAHSIPAKQLKTLRSDEVVLDNATGDVYQYDQARHEFFPAGNVGIHYHKAAQDSKVAREAILKPYTYVPQVVDDPYPVFTGQLHEIKARVLKQCSRHWLVQGLGLQEFIVPQQNAWDMHPLNMTQSANHLVVLADSPRGPQVITWRDNFVGVQFHVDPKYVATVTVLRNFVMHQLFRFEHEHQRFDLRLASIEHVAKLSAKQMLLDRERKLTELNLPLETESRPWSGTTRATSARPQTAKSRASTARPTTASLLRLSSEQAAVPEPRPSSPNSGGLHSGFAFSKRHHEQIIVGNNATTETAITLTSARPRSPLIRMTPVTLRDCSPDTDRLGSPKSLVIAGDFDKAASVSRLRFFYGIGNTVQVSPCPEPIAAEAPALQQSEKTTQNTLEYKSAAGSEQNEKGVWKQKREIRALLHPGYAAGGVPKGLQTLTSNKSDNVLKDKKTIKLKVKRVSYTSIHRPEYVDPFPKTRTTNYPNLGLTVANDGTKYRDPGAQEREEAKQSKAKWVSNRDFDLALGASHPPEVKNYVRLTPSQPPAAHQFREEDKGRWIAGQFRVASY